MGTVGSNPIVSAISALKLLEYFRFYYSRPKIRPNERGGLLRLRANACDQLAGHRTCGSFSRYQTQRASTSLCLALPVWKAGQEVSERLKVVIGAEAERLIRDLARRMEKEAPGVSGSLLEGLDEMLTVNRLRLPPELRRSLACTNAIENMQGTIRRVTRNVKRWRDASMALRWAAAGMLEAKAGFRRLKAYRHLPALRRALAEDQSRRLERPG